MRPPAARGRGIAGIDLAEPSDLVKIVRFVQDGCDKRQFPAVFSSKAREVAAAMAHTATRVMRSALAVVLALYMCVPVAALAAEQGSPDSAGESAFRGAVSPQEIGTDLSVAWAGQSGGTEKAYTVAKGGTYYLSRDLSTASNLVIDAAGEDVTLRFDGHKLTVDGDGSSSQKAMVSIVAARSVAFDGSASGSALVSAGKLDVWGVTCAAKDCAVSADGLAITLSTEVNTQRNLGTHAVRMAAGSLSLSGCTVSMNMGNQALRSSSLVGETDFEVPSAVYATADVDSVELTDCTVVGEGTSGFNLDDVADTTSVGNAYAVYSLAKSTRVKGGSYKAVSLRGNATCLYGSSLQVLSGDVSSPVALEADAGQLATGVLSMAPASVTLSAPLSFTVAQDFEGVASARAALRSTVEGGFVLGDCVPDDGVTYPALIMLDGDDLASANASGYGIGAFDGTLSRDKKASLVDSVLVNALDTGCSVAQDALGYVRFAFGDTSNANGKAVAKVGSTFYPTLPEALEAFTDGSTLQLLKDVGTLAVSRVKAGTIDLNGHTACSLAFTTEAEGAGLVVKGGSVGPSATSVSHSSPSPLTLSDVEVRSDATDGYAYGVSVASSAGALTVRGASSIEASASRVSGATSYSAYGVYVPTNAASGPAITIEDGSRVAAYALTAGISAYGMYSPTSATVKDSAVYATGSTGPVCAAYIGGALDAQATRFEAFTSDVASSACDIQLRTSRPAASDVSVRGCTLLLRSATGGSDLPDTGYACILGATSDAGTSAPTGALTLAGSNTFVSASGVHVGMNVGNIALGGDFGLAPGSDGPLVVSQAKNTDEIGISVDGTPTSAQARLFEAKPGSYYEGWALQPDTAAGRLTWYPDGYRLGSGVFQLSHGGSSTRFASLSDALEAAASGDTVTLLGDALEPGIQVVSQEDLTLDLNGNKLAIRGGNEAVMDGSASGGALQYTGTGTFTVTDSSGQGELDVTVGAAAEPTAGATYQGVCVSGGGKLVVNDGVAMRVDYTGSTASTAVQRSVALHGIAVPSGTLEFGGSLSVSSALRDGAIGAMDVYGVFAQPASGARSYVTMADTARVSVEGRTAASTTENQYYAESASTQVSPFGLREIHIDPKTDADFYRDVVSQFRVSATYDDPDDSSLRNAFGARIYFAQNMVIDHGGAWYDGLRIWAFSDEVTGADVGKLDSIVPTHFFVSTSYDTLPNAYGVASGSEMQGTAVMGISGEVTVECSHGNAYALDAEKAGGSANWTCTAATLSATADSKAHPLAQSAFDLRDFVDFKATSQTDRVSYSNTLSTQYVKYVSPEVRDVVIGDSVMFTFEGATTFKTSGLDAASVEAPSMFRLSGTFGLGAESDVCSVANSSGANSKGTSFAMSVTGDAVDPAWFEDAYGTYKVGMRSAGVPYWAAETSYTATFMVADAVVARYVEPTSVSLSEPSAAALRVNDQRQTYGFAGWSLSADENATSGYLAPDATIEPNADCVYHAVYTTDTVAVPVAFTNVFDSDGVLQEPLAIDAAYGATVGDALAAAGAAMPEPSDYVSSGFTYRFVGWHLFTASSPVAALTYGSDQVKDVDVTLARNGVSTNGMLTLRATYRAVKPGQHLIEFAVDDRLSSCVVEDGAHPDFTLANNTNTNYVVPSKLVTEVGKTFTFGSWFVDSDSDGELGEGEASYESVLPKATADAVYKASWSWAWSDVTLTFYVKYLDEETGRFDDNGVRVMETTYERTTQDVADEVAKVGSKLGYGGKVYTLDGWSSRKSDVEPVYDAGNPLPSVTGDDRSLSSDYAKTFYGVYSTSEHMVGVTFYDGSSKLGSTNISGLRTVDEAFAATKASKPHDKSASERFLGWAMAQNAATAIDGVSSSLDDVVGTTAETATFYAVYGKMSTYSMRFWSEDGKKALYKISVQGGSTVNKAAKKAGVTIAAPSSTGKYFSGWRTAAKKYYSLDTTVLGSASLYASYGKIRVSTGDAKDINATVTSTKSALERAAGVEFTIVPRDSADSPLRSESAKYSYSILKSYDIRLVATAEDGTKTTVTGDFGASSVKVHVGTGYRNTQVRAFWLGDGDGTETVMHSAVKKVDANGYITFSIGNYGIGDADEGGNLSIAYIEGGSSGGSLSGGGNSPGLGRSTSRSLGSSSGSSLSSKPRSGLASGSKLGSGLSDGSSKPSGSGASSEVDDAGVAASDIEGEDVAADSVADEDGSMFGDWDSDAIVLLALSAIALSALLGGLWRLVVVRQRQQEAEVELPSMADEYAKGITF